MINTATYIFFALFILSSLIEIVLAFNEIEHYRKIVKPFSLFFLSLAVIVTLPHHPLIYIGTLLGMAGDIFLIFNKKPKIFLLGLIVFLLGHFAYIGEILFVMMAEQPPVWWFYVVVLFAMLLITLSAYPFAKKITQSRYLALLGNIYLSTLILVTIVSLIATLNGYANFMILGIVGGVSFLASDLILTKATFIKDFKRRDYYIMLFYLLGQTFIVLGISLTYLL